MLFLHFLNPLRNTDTCLPAKAGLSVHDFALSQILINPLSEKMHRHSPYNHAFNNPIYFIDPDGMMPQTVSADEDVPPIGVLFGAPFGGGKDLQIIQEQVRKEHAKSRKFKTGIQTGPLQD